MFRPRYMAINMLSNKRIKKEVCWRERQDTKLTATLLLYANTPLSLFILHNTEFGKPVPNKQEHVSKNSESFHWQYKESRTAYDNLYAKYFDKFNKEVTTLHITRIRNNLL